MTQVCLDPHGVQLAFESGLTITAELCIEQIEPDGSKSAYQCLARDGPPLVLHRLLSRRIEGVRRADLSLTLDFEGGSSLTVFTSIGPYESGHIAGPDYPLTVF